MQAADKQIEGCSTTPGDEYEQKRADVHIEIRPLQPGEDGAPFRTLNEEWISRYFILEARDVETLRAPQNILLDGGHIYFAWAANQVVGCVALIPVGEGVYELSKMAVSPAMRGQGIGRKILVYAIAQAKSLKVARLFLGSSSLLKNAVHLYESLGFVHIQPESLPWVAYARADVFMELPL